MYTYLYRYIVIHKEPGYCPYRSESSGHDFIWSPCRKLRWHTIFRRPTWFVRGKILHARNQHLRYHRGFSVAFPNECSVACSNIVSLVSGISERIVTRPVDVYWNSLMDVQWHFRMEFHFCELWCNVAPNCVFGKSVVSKKLRQWGV